MYKREDVRYCSELFERFYDIGATSQGGVTRLGNSRAEDEMHGKFAEIAEEMGFSHGTDRVGNTFIHNSACGDYYLIGSHLDSVVNGGRYDGVAGILAGLMVLRWMAADGVNVPVKVAAFRCEESSNFGHSTIGSGLITHRIGMTDLDPLTSRQGESMKSIFDERGYDACPPLVDGVKQYLELHIEQGKILEERGVKLGIVTTIAGYIRYNLFLSGSADHSGATPMMMRSDALCAASELVIEIERLGQRESKHQSVATVGVIKSSPNAMNVVPGDVSLGVDIRGIDKDSMNRIAVDMLTSAKEICDRRGIKFLEQKIGDTDPVRMSEETGSTLKSISDELNISNIIMSSGAGHDAMNFAPLYDTAMIFIPCTGGISHNRLEFAAIEDICLGARLIYEHIRRGNQ